MQLRLSKPCSGVRQRTLADNAFKSKQTRKREKQLVLRCQRDKNGSDVDYEKPDPGFALKAVWYGAEQVGNLIGLSKKTNVKPIAINTQKLSRSEAITMIKADYNTNYFVSGRGDMAAYAHDCLFADPFAGFKGVDRFKKNVSNLGSLMEDVKLEVTDWKETSDSLITKWRFSSVLSLPWKPVLAAAGGTTHVFDKDTGKVVKHIESWDVEPGRVVRQLLKPSARVPSNQWEVLFCALYDGDAKSIWFAVSGGVLRLGSALLAIDVGSRVLTGSGLPDLVDVVLVFAVAGSAMTSVVKFAQGMQGGDTGTGGRF